MKFKVGDKVRVLDGRMIPDPKHVCWGGAGMERYIGIETMVTKVFSRSVLLNIDRGNWCWAEYWLEKVEG